MPITLDSFRNIASEMNVVIGDGAGGPQLQKAGLFHKLNTQYNNFGARDKNQRVVDTLKQAVAAEPRYFGIREHAKGLIESIRIDKPITAGQLKSLVSYLDAMSTPEQQSKAFMSKALASAANAGGNPVRDGNLFGVPPCLQTGTPEIKAGYSKALEREYLAFAQAGQGLAQANPATIRTNFEQRISDMKQILTAANLSEQTQTTFLSHYFKHTPQDTAIPKLVGYFQQVEQADDISPKNKAFIQSYLFSETKNGVAPEQGNFDGLMKARRSMTALSNTQDALRAGTQIEDSLGKLGLNNVSFAKEKILFALDAKAKNTMIGGTPVNRADCEKIAQKLLDSYAASRVEITDAAKSPDQVKIGLRALEDIHEIPKPGYMSALFKATENIPMGKLTQCVQSGDSVQLHKALASLNASIYTEIHAIDPKIKPDMGSFNTHARVAILGTMLSKLPVQEKQSLAQMLARPDTQQLYNLYGAHPRSGEAVIAMQTLAFMREQLSFLTNQELAPLVDQPLDAQDLPLALRSRFSKEDLFSGTAPLEAPGRSIEQIWQTADSNLDSLIQISFQSEMQHLTSGQGVSVFEKDINRTMGVYLPDGNRVPNNFAEAKDTFARFVTGQTDASYAGLSPADKNRAHVLMALISQEMEKSSMYAITGAITPNNEQAFAPMSSTTQQDIRRFDIRLGQDGGFEVAQSATMFTGGLVSQQGNLTLLNGDTSKAEYAVTVRISGQEMNRLSGLDWGAFSQQETPHLGAEALMHSREHLNSDFCINADLDFGAQFHFDAE